MSRRIILVLLSALLLPSLAAAQIVVPAVWQTQTTTTVSGDLNGVPVTVSGAGTIAGPAAVLPYDLSTADYAPYALSSTQACVDYPFDQNWSAAFGAPVSNLMLYCKFWRGPNQGPPDPPVFEYRFDQPFTVLTGFANSTVSGTTLQVPSTIFQDGILLFAGPVTSVGLVANNGNNGSRQGLTFAVEGEPVSDEGAAWGAVKALFR